MYQVLELYSLSPVIINENLNLIAMNPDGTLVDGAEGGKAGRESDIVVIRGGDGDGYDGDGADVIALRPGTSPKDGRRRQKEAGIDVL